ncbi:MAG: nitroreductase family protein, partial [Prevotellaceae bacterium]|nr:nitroreductase family protein [Prevotellaceae bacterium]
MEDLKNRKTIRRYQQKEIPAELLNDLFEAAFHASTVGNMQTYSVVVTRDAARKAKLAPAHFHQPMVETAPVVLTFCIDLRRFSKWC